MYDTASGPQPPISFNKIRMLITDAYLDSMASGFLYIGFLFGSYPASLLAQLFPVSRVAGGIIFVWAACLILTVVCHNFPGVVTQRVFLGFLEGGVSPIFVLVTASWYTKC